MKKILSISMIICVCSTISFAQHNLTIKITNLRSNKGQIHLSVLDKNKKKVAAMSGKIKNKECIIVIKNLSSCEYAFQYFHDENNNNELDSNWLKIPKEGYGFSNNAIGKYGPPSFEQWVFEINDHKKVVCYPTY